MIHHHLSNRVNSLSESATLQMTRRSRELKDAGIDVINLSIGELILILPRVLRRLVLTLFRKILLIILQWLVSMSYVRPLPLS